MTDRAKVRLMLAAAATSALTAANSFGQILYEPFNYTSGAQLDTDAAGANKNFTTSGTYWSLRGTQSGLFTVASGLGAPTNPAVPPLPSAMGNSAQYPLTGTTGRVAAINFGQTFTTEGDYYYSLEIKTPTGTLSNTAGTLAGFTNFSIPTPAAPTLFQGGLRYVPVTGNTQFRLGLAPNGGTAQDVTAPDKTFDAGDTVFAVVKYHINPAGRKDDTMALWVNPTSGFGNNGAIPTPDATFDNATISSPTATPDSVDAVTNAPMLAGLFFRSFSATTGFQIDEVRVDNTWAGVTPNGNLQYTWNNAGGGTVADDSKWDKLAGAPAAHPNGSGHVANFGPGIASGSAITSAGETLDTVNFTNAGSLTLNGTGVTFDSQSSAAQVVAYSGTHTISAPITSNGNLSLKTQGSGTSITLGSGITMAGASNKTLGVYGTGSVILSSNNQIDPTARLEARSGTLNLNGTTQAVNAVQLGTSHPNNGAAIGAGVFYNGDLASGTISNGTISAGSYDLQSGTISATLAGSNGVAKNLAGKVTLSGNNTYSGNTTVNNGVLTLSGTNSQPVIAVLNVPSSIIGGTATLALTSNASLGANNATVTYASTGGVGGTLQFNNDMTLASDRTISAVAAKSRLAVIAGKTATIDASIGGTGGIDVTYPFDDTVASAGTPTPTSGGVATTGGTVVLHGTNNTYAGTTRVSGGRLLLPTTTSAPGFGVAGRFATTAPPDFPQSGTPAAPSSAGAVLSVSYGGATDWAAADVDTLRTTTTWGTSTLAPAATYLGFDTANATAPATYALGIPSGAHGVSKYSAGTLTLSGDLAQTGGVDAAGGTLVLGGNNSYAGQTIFENSAILRVTSSTALGSTAANTIIGGGGGANANAGLQVDGSTTGPLTIAEPFSLTGKTASTNASPHIDNVGGNNTITGTVSFSTGGSFYNLSSSAGSLTINTVDNPQGAATLRQLNLRGAANGSIGAITNTGAGTNFTVVKFDSGTWTLTGSNAFTAGATVNAGRLQAVQTASLPGYNAPGKIAVNATGTLGVNVGGGSEWAAGDIDTLRANATFATGSALAFDSTNASPGTPFVYGSNISGGYGITKLGANTVDLSGTNSYTGGTSVQAGTLIVNRLHENNPVSITGGTLQVRESSPKLSDGIPSGNNAFVSRPGGIPSIANNGAPLGSRVYTGTLDLTNNDLIVDYSGASPLADVRDMVRSGYNAGHWNGTGISSSTAANINAFNAYALGVVENSALVIKFGDGTGDGSPAAGNAGHGPLFSGQAVDLTTVLVKFTHKADVDLDGVITSNDAAIFNGNYSDGAPATWSTGDLNYDGIYTSDDAAIFNGAYDESLAHLPEPGVALGGVIALVAYGARRRRS